MSPSIAEAIVAAFITLSGADAFDGWRITIPDNVPADAATLADPLDPVAQSHLWEAIFPSIPHGAIVNTCILESGCRRIKPTSRFYLPGTAIHKLDRKAGQSSYRGAYRRGFLKGCPEFWPNPADVDQREFPEDFYETASTRGNFGAIVAFNVLALGSCIPFEVFDVPFFSAWSAAVKIDRICKKYERVRKKPCTMQAIRCAWAQAKWGSNHCGRVIRKMKKALGRSRMRKHIDESYHPTLADFRRAHDAHRTATDAALY